MELARVATEGLRMEPGCGREGLEGGWYEANLGPIGWRLRDYGITNVHFVDEDGAVWPQGVRASTVSVILAPRHFTSI